MFVRERHQHHFSQSFSSFLSPPCLLCTQTTKAVSAIAKLFPPLSLLLHTVCRILSHTYHTPPRAGGPFRELSTVVAQPIMAFHAFVNDAAEAGQDPDITKPWTGLDIWLRHRCPPYGG